MSETKKFRQDVHAYEGMAWEDLVLAADNADAKINESFDAWRREAHPNILHIDRGRFLSHNLDRAPFLVWMNVLFDDPLDVPTYQRRSGAVELKP